MIRNWRITSEGLKYEKRSYRSGFLFLRLDASYLDGGMGLVLSVYVQ